MYYPAGEDISVNLVFDRNSDPVIPIAGSVYYSLRDYDGSLLITNQAVSTGAADLSADISIPAAHNSIGSDRLQKRTITYKYKVGSMTYHRSKVYYLVPFVNFSVSAADVRSLIGCNESELPDQDVDLYFAYFRLEERVGQSDLETALSAASVRSIEANQAVAIQAALSAIPTLKLRLASREEANGRAYERFEKIDFDKLERHLVSQLDVLARKFTDTPEEQFELFITAGPTDPITGA